MTSVLIMNHFSAVHPKVSEALSTTFLGKNISSPLWISSMTGGSVNANRVNKQLAEVCSGMQLGMGLGSCGRFDGILKVF